MESRPSTAQGTALALEKLKGMKFMMRKEEAARIQALGRQRHEDQHRGATSAATTSVNRLVGASSDSQRKRPTVINVEELNTTATVTALAARMRYGERPVASPAEPVQAASNEDDAVADDQVSGNRRKGAQAAQPRFYLPEGDRAPALPKGLARKHGKGESDSHRPSNRRRDDRGDAALQQPRRPQPSAASDDDDE